LTTPKILLTESPTKELDGGREGGGWNGKDLIDWERIEWRKG